MFLSLHDLVIFASKVNLQRRPRSHTHTNKLTDSTPHQQNIDAFEELLLQLFDRASSPEAWSLWLDKVSAHVSVCLCIACGRQRMHLEPSCCCGAFSCIICAHETFLIDMPATPQKRYKPDIPKCSGCPAFAAVSLLLMELICPSPRP
jgi:hypothetical protein